MFVEVGSPKDLVERLAEPQKAIATGARLGMTSARVPVINLFRKAYRLGGLGRLAMAWVARSYPRGGKALSPSLWVTARGGANTRGALVAHGLGAVIRANKGRYLPVPTKLAGKYVKIGNARQRITPEAFERKTGIKLQFVPGRGGRPPLLVAPDVRVSGRGRVAAPKGGPRTKRGRYKSGISTAVMFVLVSAVRIKRSADLGRLKARGEKLVTHKVNLGISHAISKEATR